MKGKCAKKINCELIILRTIADYNIFSKKRFFFRFPTVRFTQCYLLKKNFFIVSLHGINSLPDDQLLYKNTFQHILNCINILLKNLNRGRTETVIAGRTGTLLTIGENWDTPGEHLLCFNYFSLRPMTEANMLHMIILNVRQSKMMFHWLIITPFTLSQFSLVCPSSPRLVSQFSLKCPSSPCNFSKFQKALDGNHGRLG